MRIPDYLNYWPLPWLLLVFLFCNVYARHDGGGNPWSRTATMASIVERQSYEITPYTPWTMDWSQTPDGKKYSNKAPGPMLLGLPAFWAWDAWQTKGADSEEARDLIRVERRESASFFVSLFIQILPMLFLSLACLNLLFRAGVSRQAQIIFLVAALFANTFALKLNTNFGHGLTGFFALLCAWAWLKKNYFLLGLGLGCTLLSDYSGLFLLASFALCFTIYKEWSVLLVKGIFLGSIFPALLWIHYHFISFGSPFKISTHFQNPVFQDLKHKTTALFGVIDVVPNGDIVWNLLRGSTRGLLQTQSWVLLFVLFLVFHLFRARAKNEAASKIGLLSVLTFSLLFYMNSSFGGWYGGATIGPRYLCYIFPVMALALSFHWEQMPKLWKSAFTLTLVIGSIFYVLTMSTTITAPNSPIWEFMIDHSLLEKGTELQRGRFKLLGSLFIITLAVLAFARRKIRAA